MGVPRTVRAVLMAATLVAGCGSPATPTTASSTSNAGPTPAGSESTPAPSSGDEQPVTLIYTGTLTESRVGYSNPTQVGITRDLEISWTFSYTGPIGVLDNHLPQPNRVWSSVQVSGHLLQISYDGFGTPTVDCSGTYVALPDQVPNPVVQNPSSSGDPSRVSVLLVMPNIVGGGATVHGDCQGDPNSYGGPSIPGSANVTETSPRAEWDLASGGSKDFDRTLDFNDGTPSIPDNNHLDLQSTVSLTPVDQSCELAAGSSMLLAAYRSGAGGDICPLITWTNPPTGSARPVNNKSQDIAIGQAVKLRAELCCGGDPTGHTIEWRVGGGAIANFDIGPNGSHGHVVPLQKPITTRDVTVYWPTTGTQSVFLLIDGKPASTTFVASGPTTATLSADQCGVGLDPPVGTAGHVDHYGLATPAFGLGLNAVCPSSGVALHGYMDGGPPGMQGLIQLIVDTLKTDKGTCDVIGMPADAVGAFAADQQAIYGNYTNTASGPYEDSDSPALSLVGKVGTFTRLFVAQDYYAYKPDASGTDAIWVPLRRLIWRWTATASGSGTAWTVTGSPTNATPTQIQSTEFSGFPDWSWATVNANGFACP